MSVRSDKILPDGIDAGEITNPFTQEKRFARKGSVAAFYNNIAMIDKLAMLPDSVENQEKFDEIALAMEKGIPMVDIVGVFHLFTPAEWLSSSDRPGRFLAGLCYLKFFPEKSTQELKKIILVAQDKIVYPLLKKEAVEVLKLLP